MDKIPSQNITGLQHQSDSFYSTSGYLPQLTSELLCDQEFATPTTEITYTTYTNNLKKFLYRMTRIKLPFSKQKFNWTGAPSSEDMFDGLEIFRQYKTQQKEIQSLFKNSVEINSQSLPQIQLFVQSKVEQKILTFLEKYSDNNFSNWVYLETQNQKQSPKVQKQILKQNSFTRKSNYPMQQRSQQTPNLRHAFTSLGMAPPDKSVLQTDTKKSTFKPQLATTPDISQLKDFQKQVKKFYEINVDWHEVFPSIMPQTRNTTTAIQSSQRVVESRTEYSIDSNYKKYGQKTTSNTRDKFQTPLPKMFSHPSTQLETRLATSVLTTTDVFSLPITQSQRMDNHKVNSFQRVNASNFQITPQNKTTGTNQNKDVKVLDKFSPMQIIHIKRTPLYSQKHSIFHFENDSVAKRSPYYQQITRKQSSHH